MTFSAHRCLQTLNDSPGHTEVERQDSSPELCDPEAYALSVVPHCPVITEKGIPRRVCSVCCYCCTSV